MKQYNTIEALCDETAVKQGTCITIGVFDGMHLGHRALIRNCVEEAKLRNIVPLVLTFQNHPLCTLAPSYAPKSILPPERKTQIMEELGCELYVNVEFNRNFAELSPEDFAAEVLSKACNAKLIVAGYDFSFGWQGKGDVVLLRELGKKYGFEVIDMNPISCGDLRVKSTMIRETLNLGQVDVAAWMLGRPYEFKGVVVTGHGRGRTLGFPTANLKVDSGYVLPARGVYAVRIHIEDDWRHYGAMLNIGDNPTFNEIESTIEAHLFSFSGDLVGKELSVYFVKRLRAEVKFDNKETLIEQLQKDEIDARQALGSTQLN